MRERLLIVEDDAAMRDLLQEDLEQVGYATITAADGREALAFIHRERDPIDLVITDVQMPGLKGDELLAALRQHRPEAPVIIITAFGSVGQAVEMMKKGAFQYLTKPFETSELLDLIAQALAQSAPQREQARLRRELPAAPPRLIGASRPMRQLIELIAATLAGRKPNIPSYSVCIECKRGANVCIAVARGIPCLGPVTQAGCGALCPSYDRGCYGCYGPMESSNPTSLTNQFYVLGQSPEQISRAFRGFNAWAWQFRNASEQCERQ